MTDDSHLVIAGQVIIALLGFVNI